MGTDGSCWLLTGTAGSCWLVVDTSGVKLARSGNY